MRTRTILLLCLALIPILTPLLTHQAQAATSPSFDTSGVTQGASHGCSLNPTNCISAQMTTTVTGDLIFAWIAYDTPQTSRGIFDNAGNTYTNYTNPTFGTVPHFETYSAVHELAFYYTIWKSSGLLNITFSTSGLAGNQIFGMLIFAISPPYIPPLDLSALAAPGPSGSVVSSPPTASINCLGTCYSRNPSGMPPNATISMSTQNTMNVLLIGLYATDGAGVSNVGPGSGMTAMSGMSGTGIDVYGEYASATLPFTKNVLITLSGDAGGACSVPHTCNFGGAFFAIDGPPVRLGTEPQQVLFKDDFLTQTVYPSSLWTVDLFTTPTTTTFQNSGFLTMTIPQSAPQLIQTSHVSTPSFAPGSIADLTAVKRKLTAGLIPFTKSDANTANVRIGFSQLLTVGTYPGSIPAGSPFPDQGNNCAAINSNDAIGSEYLVMDNTGSVTAVACGDGQTTRTVLETGLNPALYTVFTVEPFAVYCNFCIDHQVFNESWTFFRVYQEDKNGNLISSTDQNTNMTTGTAPLFKNSYVFASLQSNGNSGVTSRIDIVQLQNYGSPVNLLVPLAIPFPTQTSSSPGVIGLFADMATWIGNGNPQLGAGFLFLVWMGVFITPLAMATRKVFIVGVGGLLSISLFAYAGLIPTWVIVIMIFGTVILAALLFKMLVGDVGGSSEGDASETIAGTGLE